MQSDRMSVQPIAAVVEDWQSPVTDLLYGRHWEDSAETLRPGAHTQKPLLSTFKWGHKQDAFE